MEEQRQDLQKLFTISILHFNQGINYGLESRFIPLLYRLNGMSLSKIGIFRLPVLPWGLKFLWVPDPSKVGRHKRNMVLFNLALLTSICILSANLDPEIHLFTLLFAKILINGVISINESQVDHLQKHTTFSQEPIVSSETIKLVCFKLGGLLPCNVGAWYAGYISWDLLCYFQAGCYIIGMLFCVIFLPPDPARDSNQVDAGINTETDIPGRGASNTAITSSPETIRGPVRMLSPSQRCSQTNTASLEVECSTMVKIKSIFHNLLVTEGMSWLLFYLLFYKLGETGMASMFPLFLLDKKCTVSFVNFFTGFFSFVFTMLGSTLGNFLSTKENTTYVLQSCFSGLLLSECLILTAMYFWDDYSWIMFAPALFSFSLFSLFGAAISSSTLIMAMEMSRNAPQNYQSNNYTVVACMEIIGKFFISAISGMMVDHTGYFNAFLIFLTMTFCVIPIIKARPE